MARNREQKGDGMIGAEDARQDRDRESNTERTPTGDRANLGSQVDQRQAGSVEREPERVGSEGRTAGTGQHDDRTTRTDRNSIDPSDAG